MATLRAEIRRYEEQYGIPSDRLEEAVKSGELIENLEVCDWLILYSLLLRAETWISRFVTAETSFWCRHARSRCHVSRLR